jgi:hypothetical protein
MKLFTVMLASCLLGFAPASAAHEDEEGSSILDNVSIDVVDDQVVITDRNNDGNFIIISADYELTIRDDPVSTGRKQKKTLEEYYCLALEIDRLGLIIADKAAELGSMAEGIALYALLQLAESFTGRDYTEGDDAFDHEQVVGELEEGMESVAEEFGELIEQLEAAHERLKVRIPALHELDWL